MSNAKKAEKILNTPANNDNQESKNLTISSKFETLTMENATKKKKKSIFIRLIIFFFNSNFDFHLG